MSIEANILENNTLAALSARAPAHVTSAIKKAAAKTGVDFAYLMEKAAAESSFRPDAKAKSSSASGLYQFIESTWVDMVDRHGAKYGIGKNAGREEVLNLRQNPQAAAYMAAEFAKENKAFLQKHTGGDIGTTELYMAHFMGAGGATGFLNALKDSPLTPAADLFPKEASANRNVFYDSNTGQPKTLQQIYDHFDTKFSSKVQHANAPKTPVYKAYSAPSYNISALSNPMDLYQTAMRSYLETILFDHLPRQNRSEGQIFPASLYGNPGFTPFDLNLADQKSL